MSKFISFLEAAGKDIEKGLSVVLPIAQAATPFVTAADPAIGGLFSTTVATVVSVEQKFAAMSKQSGSGTQKLGEVTQILAPVILQTFASAGVEIDNSHVSNYINAVVALLNALPSLTVKQ